MTRFGFDIRTRSGQPVDNINILAASREDAERRLRQMYHDCVIVQCRSNDLADRHNSLDVATVIGMISDAPRDPATVRRDDLTPEIDVRGDERSFRE